MDGLWESAHNIKWRFNKNTLNLSKRYIIHLADAPPHGDLYTGKSVPLMNRSFIWSKGCPCGISIE